MAVIAQFQTFALHSLSADPNVALEPGAVGDLLIRLDAGQVQLYQNTTGTTVGWVRRGGVYDHPALTLLAWIASGHTGVSGLAGFNGAGAAENTLVGTGLTHAAGSLAVKFGTAAGDVMPGGMYIPNVPLERDRLGWTANAVPGATTLSSGAGCPAITGTGTASSLVDATGCWPVRRCAADNTAAGQVLGALFYRLDQPTAYIEWLVVLPADSVNMRWFCGLTAAASFGNGTALTNNSVTFRYLPDDGDTGIRGSYRDGAGNQLETSVLTPWVPGAIAKFTLSNDATGGITLSCDIAGTTASVTLTTGLPTPSAPMRGDYRVWRQGLGGVVTDAIVGYVCGQSGGMP